jgi:isopenicillin N synthase-like dioxygenase
MEQDGFPIVDVAAFATGDAAVRAGIAREFGRALETIGFVAIVGHGVPEADIQATYDAMKSFFALPLAEKMSLVIAGRAKTCGYLPIGVESVAATLDADQPPDLCEALVFQSLRRELNLPKDTPLRPGEGARNVWPEQPAGLRGLVTRYFEAVERLALMLPRIMALALDLPEDFFAPYYTVPALTLRFVNYPDQIDPPAPGQLRYGAHHDYGGLTILRQDTAPGGLQICDKSGTWRDVPAVPEAFIINVAELIARWTNERWKSTLHRVVNPSRALTGSTQRLSMVLFTGPNDDAEITCLPSCTDAAHPVLYPPVRAGAFVRAKLNKSMVAPPVLEEA